MNEIIKDYLYSTEIQLDNPQLAVDCLHVELFLKEAIQDPAPLQDYGSFTSANHSKYNLFNFHTAQINKLFRAIQKHVLAVMPKDEYMIQCWLNVFRVGQFIDWHAHWPAEHKVFHGYYCVNVGDSITSYKFPNDTGAKVQNKNGLLVYGKSCGDLHRSSEWDNPEVPRITIAFDVIPIWNIKDNPVSRHYVPI